MARWAMVSVLVFAGCTKDLCADVVCRREPIAVCAGEEAVTFGAPAGNCEPSTGQCVFSREVTNPCPQGTRCSDGACRCVPSLCAGCCTAASACVSPAQVSPSVCGASGVTCKACPAQHVCGGATCQPCGATEVVRGNGCVSDDTAWRVEVDGGVASSAFVLGDAGLTVSQLRGLPSLSLVVVTRDPAASINGQGPRLELVVDVSEGLTRVPIEVRAPSGRLLLATIHSAPAELLSHSSMYPDFDGGTLARRCHLREAGELSCTTDEVPDAGPFLTLHESCGVTVRGDVWCRFEHTRWLHRFTDPSIVDGYFEAALTRDGRILKGGAALDAGALALMCNDSSSACVYLDGARQVVRLWQSTAPAMPGTYERLAAHGAEGYMAKAVGEGWYTWTGQSGVWRRVAIPGTSNSTVEVSEMRGTLLGLEEDGSAWLRFPDGGSRAFDAGGASIIDIAQSHWPVGFVLLTSDRQVLAHP
ncbi:MAG: hypothetical protein Q8K32_32365 [Archangium sp.]|nr:hypothetical protein [Archangium sp.]